MFFATGLFEIAPKMMCYELITKNRRGAFLRGEKPFA
jgi:hypothetical protein